MLVGLSLCASEIVLLDNDCVLCFRLGLNEIADILAEEEGVLEDFIAIISSHKVESDVDSGEEDEVDLNRLSRNQLFT